MIIKKELLTQDEKKILADFSGSPEWLILKKVLANHYENIKTQNLMERDMRLNDENRGEARGMLWVQGEIRRIREAYQKGKTKDAAEKRKKERIS